MSGRRRGPEVGRSAGNRTSSLRHLRQPQALIHTLAFGEVNWVIAAGSISEAADGEAWNQRKDRLCSSFRLVQRAKQRERGSQPEMCVHVISIGLDAAAEPADCFSILVKLQLGKAGYHEPSMAEDITRRQAKCFVDMSHRLRSAPHVQLSAADLRVSLSQIVIQRQRPLELSDALSRAVRAH